MRKEWQIKKISEICNIDYGTRVVRSRITPGNYNVYGGGGKTFSINKYNREDCTIVSRFAMSNHCVRTIKGKFFLNDSGLSVSTKDKNILCQDFLDNFLFSFEDKIYNLGRGQAQRNLHIDAFKEIEIPIPPIEVQKKIVKILDDKFEKLNKAKKIREDNILNAEKILSQNLREIFKEGKNKGWEEKKLSEVCEKITDGTHQTPTYYDNGILFLSSKNVVGGKIDWDDIKYIDQKQHIEMHKRVAPSLGDILLAKNGTTGVGAIVDRNVTFDIYVSLALLRAKSVILPHFLLHFINSPIAKNQFNQRLKGAGVPNLHLNEIREVKIWFPKSLSDQQKIVIKLDNLSEKIKKLKELQNSQLEDFYKLEKAYLKEAFNSELI